MQSNASSQISPMYELLICSVLLMIFNRTCSTFDRGERLIFCVLNKNKQKKMAESLWGMRFNSVCSIGYFTRINQMAHVLNNLISKRIGHISHWLKLTRIFVQSSPNERMTHFEYSVSNAHIWIRIFHTPSLEEEEREKDYQVSRNKNLK